LIKDKNGKVLGYTSMEILEMFARREKWEKEHPIFTFLKNIFWNWPLYYIPERIRMSRYRIKWFFQRMRHGFSDDDFFAAGDYIIKATADMLEYFAENTNGHPIDTTYEEFIAKIKRIASAYREYLDMDESGEHIEARNAAIDALIKKEIDYDRYDEITKEIYEKESARKEELFKIMAELYKDGFIERLWN
jgi:hypothetical protein